MTRDEPGNRLLRKMRRTRRRREVEQAARAETLDLPKVWTFSEDRVIEALVLELERRGKAMPGLDGHAWALVETDDGDFVLAAERVNRPQREERSDQ